MCQQSVRIQYEPKIADQHVPQVLLMSLGSIVGTLEAILGNAEAILALSWEDLWAIWVHLGALQ